MVILDRLENLSLEYLHTDMEILDNLQLTLVFLIIMAILLVEHSQIYTMVKRVNCSQDRLVVLSLHSKLLVSQDNLGNPGNLDSQDSLELQAKEFL